MLVDWVTDRPGRVVRDHGLGAFVLDLATDPVAVIGGVRHDDLGREVLDQGVSLRRVSPVAGREGEAHRTAKPAYGHVDLGAQAAARASKGLIVSPFFAPEAC